MAAKKSDLAQLHENLEEATRVYESAKEAEKIARSEACSALSKLNGAQKALDTLISEMRKGAHHDTNWSRQT